MYFCWPSLAQEGPSQGGGGGKAGGGGKKYKGRVPPVPAATYLPLHSNLPAATYLLSNLPVAT